MALNSFSLFSFLFTFHRVFYSFPTKLKASISSFIEAVKMILCLAHARTQKRSSNIAYMFSRRVCIRSARINKNRKPFCEFKSEKTNPHSPKTKTTLQQSCENFCEPITFFHGLPGHASQTCTRCQCKFTVRKTVILTD